MRIGIITLGTNKNILSYKNIIEKILTENKHSVKQYDGSDENESIRFTVEKHLVFFVDSGSLFGKNYETQLDNYLKSKGNINVKYCSLFINNRPFNSKTFLNYMAILEKHGFIIQYSDIVENDAEMREIGNFLTFQE